MQNFDKYEGIDNIPEGMRPHESVDPWGAADKSWLKAKGRSLRTVMDSVGRTPHDRPRRFRAAGIGIAVIAGMVGLSSVVAGTSGTGNFVTASLNPLAPLGFLAEQLSGALNSSPASAQSIEEECGPLAEDVAGATDNNATAEIGGVVDGLNPLVTSSLPPLVPGGIPVDFPTLPPVGDPFPEEDPEPPTEPPTEPEPPIVPPTTPPTSDNEGDLIGADVNLFGKDVIDIGILDGGLLGVNVNGLDPDGTGTDLGVSVTDGDGEELVGVNLDPQDDDPIDVNVNGTDVTENLPDVLGDDALGDVLGDDLLGDDLLGDVLGGDAGGGLLDDVLGDDGLLGGGDGGLLGGLLN